MSTENHPQETPFSDKPAGLDMTDKNPKIKQEPSNDEYKLGGDPSICNHDERFNDLDTKITQCLEQDIQTHMKLDVFQNSLTLLFQLIGSEAGALFNVEATDEDDSSETSTHPVSKLDKIDHKIGQCMSSNKRTHLKLDNLQRALDTVLKYFESNSENMISADTEEESEIFHFPISTLNEFNKLDKELNTNPKLMSDLVTKFTKVAGDSGIESVKKVGIKIIERIITPKLLTQFSWTGRKFGPNQKLPFMNYCSIFKLFQQVISKADRSFNVYQCENFLRTSVLKHSSQRLARKFNAAQSKSSKLVDGVSLAGEKSDSFSHNNQSTVPEQDSFIEELEDAEGIMVDSKENSMNQFLYKCSHEDKLDGMDRKMSTCIESNVQMHSKLDRMQETFQLILNTIGIGEGGELDCVPGAGRPQDLVPVDGVQDNILDSFQFPITTVSDLKNLNRKLSANENFENQLTNKIMSFVGNPKRMSLQRFGLEVVEYVVSLQLLLKYTWTGRTNGNKRKLALMKYRYLVSFFQKVISKADDTFTRKECEKFLKYTVLKYIKLRVARKGEYYSDEDYNNDLDINRPNFEEIPIDLDETFESKYEMDSKLDEEDGNYSLDFCDEV